MPRNDRSDTLIEEFEHAGQKVEIHYDRHCDMNPRTEYDNVGTLCIWHRRYDMSDKDAPKSPEELISQVAYKLYKDDDKVGELEEMSFGKALTKIKEDHPKFVILTVHMYDHSGVSLSTSSFSAYDPGGWDSGPVGFIYCFPEQVDHEWGGDVQKAEDYLKGEIKDYDSYQNGEIYGYIINPDSKINHESCWGFLGDEKYVEEEARRVAEAIAERQNGQKTRRVLLKVAVTYVSDPDVPEEKVLDGLYMKANLAMADVKDVTVEEIVVTEDAE